MDRYRLYPIFLLSGSLVVLVIMVAVRAFTNNNQTFDRDLPRTTVSRVVETEDIQTHTPTHLPIPSETATLEPTSTILVTTETQTPTATDSIETEVPDGCDTAGLVADVTIPDGTELEPGAHFTKTWRSINNGTCTWTSDYELYFYSGNVMGGPDSQRLVSIPVPPGTSIDVSVDLIAPTEEGQYTGYWALKNVNGDHFGIGPFNYAIYVEIKVKDPQATSTDSPVFTDTPVP